MKRQIHLKQTASKQWQYTHIEDGEQLYPWQFGTRDPLETIDQAVARFGPERGPTPGKVESLQSMPRAEWRHDYNESTKGGE